MTLMFNANTTVHDVVPDYNYATYDGCATTLFQLTLTSHCFVSNVEHENENHFLRVAIIAET
jgi:hypothetical protein